MPMGTYVVMPDIEAVARTWARGLNLSGVGRKVFFAVPKPPPTADATTWRPNYPLITCNLVDGQPDPDLPSATPRVQFDVWANDKAAASALASQLVAYALSLGGTVVSGAVLAGAQVVMGPLWQPDVDANVARYVLDIQFTVHPDQ